jgi:hypothetical protein
MWRQQLSIVRPVANCVPPAGSPGGETRTVPRILGATTMRGSITRTNAGLLCIRARLVVRLGLVITSVIPPGGLTQIRKT